MPLLLGQSNGDVYVDEHTQFLCNWPFLELLQVRLCLFIALFYGFLKHAFYSPNACPVAQAAVSIEEKFLL